MNQPTSHTNDGKLLFAIAAGIIVIAAGIAVLASLGERSDRDAQDVAAMPAVRTETVEASPLTASTSSLPLETEESIADLVEAFEPVETAFAVDPSADFIREGIAAYEGRRYTEAAAYFNAEVEERADRAWTHYILALSEWKSGNAADAVASMRRSIEIDPTQVKALVNLARIENDRGEFDAALDAADQAITLDPASAEAHFLRARSLYNAGDRETALAALETSLDQDPENGYAHNLVGLIWIERGEAGPAVEAMERAVQRIAGVSFAQNNLGMALELAGRLDEAAAAYARAVELSPDHERAAMNLARLGDRVPAPLEEKTVDEQPVVAVLTESDSQPVEEPDAETATDESEIPD